MAHAYKVLERALPRLDPSRPPERRAITIHTAFGGPGARDAFELVTRAVTEDRYVVDPSLARPELGRARERFVFRLGHRGRAVTLAVRDGIVTDEFIALVRKERRSPAEDAQLEVLKRAMAGHVMALPAADVYDVIGYERPAAASMRPSSSRASSAARAPSWAATASTSASCAAASSNSGALSARASGRRSIASSRLLSASW